MLYDTHQYDVAEHHNENWPKKVFNISMSVCQLIFQLFHAYYCRFKNTEGDIDNDHDDNDDDDYHDYH